MDVLLLFAIAVLEGRVWEMLVLLLISNQVDVWNNAIARFAAVWKATGMIGVEMDCRSSCTNHEVNGRLRGCRNYDYYYYYY